MPFFEGLNGRLMLQGVLRNVLAVDLDVVAQRRFKRCCRSESCLINDVADTPIAALDQFHWSVDGAAESGDARYRIVCNKWRPLGPLFLPLVVNRSVN